MHKYPLLFKKFLFDVKDVISRTAIAMAKSGVVIAHADRPCCDVEPKRIFLPQSIKKKITSDELTLIRFLFLHEFGHIQHSPVKKFQQTPYEIMVWLRDKNLALEGNVIHAILNSLEDIRMESKLIGMYGGSRFVVQSGRRICVEKWIGQIKDRPEEEWKANAVVELIYGGHIDSGGTMFEAQMSERPDSEVMAEIHAVLVDFYPRIDLMDGPASSWEDVVQLTKDIAKKLALPENDPRGIPHNKREVRGGEHEGKGMTEQVVMGTDIFKPDHTDDDGDGDGNDGGNAQAKVEYCNVQHLCREGDERIAFNEVAQGRGADSSEGSMREVNDDRNFVTGERMASSAQRLIDIFRGMVRAKFKKPRQVGLRIAQSKISAFIKGQTLNILKSKARTNERSLAVSFLVDDSGSMENYTEGRRDHDGRVIHGVRITDAVWSAVAMLGIACDRARTPFQILRFSNQFSCVKDFSQSIFPSRGLFIMRLAGGTKMSPAVAYSRGSLRDRHELHRVMFCLTDGMLSDEHSSGLQISQAKKEGIRVIGILFADGSRSVDDLNKYEAFWDKHRLEKIWLRGSDLESGKMGSILIERLCHVIG